MRKEFCDRCGCEINNSVVNRYIRRPIVIAFFDTWTSLGSSHVLCNDCKKEFDVWMIEKQSGERIHGKR